MATVAYRQHSKNVRVWTTKTRSLTPQNTEWNCQTWAIFRRTFFLSRFWGLGCYFFFSPLCQVIVGRWSDLILMSQQSMRINVILHLFIHNLYLDNCFSSFSLDDFQIYKRSVRRSSSLQSNEWKKEKNVAAMSAIKIIMILMWMVFFSVSSHCIYCCFVVKSLRLKIDLTVWGRWAVVMCINRWGGRHMLFEQMQANEWSW